MKRHKIWAAVLCLLIIIAGFLGVSEVVWRVQVHAERQHFMQADETVRGLSEQIRLSLGKPQAQKNTKACQYTSVEFESASRSCNSAVYLTYASSPQLAEGSMIEKINLIISRLYKITPNTNPITMPGNISTYDIEINQKGIDCFVDYWKIANGKNTFTSSNSPSGVMNGILAEISCGGSAKAEYFPVTKD